MNLAIIGTGYVGLITGACFAEMGHTVICLDIDQMKIDSLNKGSIPIYEPGLEELVKRNTLGRRLFFTTDYSQALQNAQFCFIAVPTPSLSNDSCDLSYVESAAHQIGRHMVKEIIVVNKSTVPVGTADLVRGIVQKELSARKSTLSFDVASNPEFLKEGAAIIDCLKPDRIIIGADSPKTTEMMRNLYAPFIINHDKILTMDIPSAEMTKYAANAMLAARISFMNEIAEICKRVGANINEVRKGIGSDTRIGYSFLYPGVGYGGSCFPKDIRALSAKAREVGCDPILLDAIDSVNNRQKKILSQKMVNYFDLRGGIQGKTIAVWGLSFKPDTDDMREAPSLVFINDLIAAGAHLRLFDPIAMPNAQKLIKNLPNLTWCKDELDAAQNADAIALLTEWKQFRLVDFNPVKAKMKGIAFFDGRNQYKPLEMKNNGFDYIAIGIPDQLQGVS
jgi:UDPglucose 6-dehydrogenase